MKYEVDFIYLYCKGYHNDFPQNNGIYIFTISEENSIVATLPTPL